MNDWYVFLAEVHGTHYYPGNNLDFQKPDALQFHSTAVVPDLGRKTEVK